MTISLLSPFSVGFFPKKFMVTTRELDWLGLFFWTDRKLSNGEIRSDSQTGDSKKRFSKEKETQPSSRRLFSSWRDVTGKYRGIMINVFTQLQY